VTLQGVTPSTLYFSDRPQRVVGHMTTADFVELWGEGENSFASDPPNAVLAFLGSGEDAPQDAVVVIKDPELVDDHPFGRPLSPVSVCGVRRRERRRDRRRF
jgi:hypothetical protein